MIDDNNRIENTQSSLPEEIEELRLEDAAIDISFEGEAGAGANGESDHSVDNQADTHNLDQGSQPQETEAKDIGHAQVADLERQVAGLKAQIEERTGQYMRIAADFENYRKRTSKEKEDLEVQIKGNTITELLSVVDNFERARSQIKPQTEAEMTIHKSYQSVYKQLVESLKRLGVSAMRAEGQEFDPMLHEAVMREPTNDHPEGVIMEEFVRGYILGDRVLRHAMVKVAAAPEGDSSTEVDTGHG